MHRICRRVFLLAAISSSINAADSRRGAILIDDAGCLECHTVVGRSAGHEPSRVAPELAANLDSIYSVPALVSAVWNHRPEMRQRMPVQKLGRPELTAADWEDLFAYLYSVQQLQYPAEVSRGRQVFLDKQCAGCHAVTGPKLGPGKPVVDWKTIDDPVTEVYQMWSHASSMESAAREAPWAGPGWMKLTGRDFMDLTAYIQQIQEVPRETGISLPDAASGKAPFDQFCGSCHAGPLALDTGLATHALPAPSWMDIGAGLWNHVMLMRRVPQVGEGDMRKIIAYLWEIRYRGPQGDPVQGRATFVVKGCASCHADRAIGKAVTPATLASIGWGAGRPMLQQMREKGVAWPELSAEEMADLAAYLSVK